MLTLSARSNLALLVENSTDVLQWLCWMLVIRISWARQLEHRRMLRDHRISVAQNNTAHPKSAPVPVSDR